MEKGGVSGLFGKSKYLLLVFVIITIIFSCFNTFFLTAKISNLQENKISAKAVESNINVCIDVAPPNMSPIGDKVLNVNQTFLFQVNATSPSNSTIYFYDDTDLFNISETTGLINFTPTDAQMGLYNLTIWSTHNICGINTSEQIDIAIIASHAPVWRNNTPVNQTLTEDLYYYLDLNPFVYDPDGDEIFFFSNNSNIEFPSFNLSNKGILAFTPDDKDVGTHAIAINASDLKNQSTNNFTFNVINVNEAPVIHNLPSQFLLCEDTFFGYSVNATDDDLNMPNSTESLFYYDNTSLFVIGEQSGLIAFFPSPDSPGHNPTRIYVTDEELLDYADSDFFVVPINDIPVMENIGAKTVWVNETFNYYVPVTDEEDGESMGGNLSFTDDTDLFNITPDTGFISFTPNDSQLGTYNITICTTDRGIPPPENYSICGNSSYLPITVCQNFSLTVTNLNRPPVITSYLPTELNMEIEETESVAFAITKEDPDGTIPTTYWYKNDELMNLSYDYWNFSTIIGDAGFYVIKVEITDGLLNDSMEWNVTVRIRPLPPPPSGGGGGGGPRCNETWACSDWYDCTNFSRIAFNDSWSNVSKTAWLDVWKNGCFANNFSLEICGIQIRYCNDLASCSTTLKRPVQYMSCKLLPPPSCYDGIRNCHHGACELLIYCGGICTPCPGEINQTEYPRGGANCGDNRCEMDELFTCSDCYMFWILCLTAMISIVMVLYLVKRRKMLIKLKQNEMKRREKIEMIKENILEIERDMELRDFRNARAIFRKTERLVLSLKGLDARPFKRKLYILKKELVGEQRYSR